ncbi:unnamed protein product [Urochloa humidicola]
MGGPAASRRLRRSIDGTDPTTTLDRRIDPLPLTAAGHSFRRLQKVPSSARLLRRSCRRSVDPSVLRLISSFLGKEARTCFGGLLGRVVLLSDMNYISASQMAAGRGITQLLKKAFRHHPSGSSLPSSNWINHKESFGFIGLRALSILGVGASGLLSFATIASADEAEHGLEAPSYPWPHAGILSSYDHASDLVSVAYTEEETKAMAAEIEVVDGPNDEGEMFTRPGKLSDRFPQPYANEQAARYANGGAYPPDLSLITKARHNGQNYVFALLTGYRDPPAGVSIREGLHYNPYFPGGAIAMPKMLMDGAVEYEDGTPATETQMGKDVVSFLSWAAEPEMEERKLMGVKWIFLLSLALLQAAYYRRMKWSIFKSRKLVLDVVN